MSTGHPSPQPGNPRRRLLGAIATLSGAAWLALFAAPALALDAPKGKVVLTVTGKVEKANGPGRADFDMAMLESLPQHSFATRTPWFAESHTFSGPLLRDVLAAAGAKGVTLGATALNNYKIDLPADDARRFKLLLATRMNGKPMAVRDKGPLFIIYPFDESEELRSERYYSRSAWQLRTLDVK